MIIDFNSGWSFCKRGGEKKLVNLPHDAMLTEQRSKACHNGDKTGFFPGGTYIYEKSFAIDANDLGKYIAILFEGVYRHTTVSVNGKDVYYHAYGYTEFTVDISNMVQVGENIITVIADNSLEPNSRWYSGSGIYRPVHLIVKDKKHISEVKIKTKFYCPAIIEVTAEAEDAKVQIFEGDNLIASGNLGEIEIPGAKLWSAEQPFLYTCIIKTAADEYKEIFGIRKIEWGASTGLLINGIETLLRGGCLHHDNGILGACAFTDAEERRVRILKEAGYNAIRSAHNPCSRALLDTCDRLGMYVMDEAFDGWYIPKTHHDYSRDFDKYHSWDIEAMVKKDINHPSVIMYSIGNEVSETSEKRGIELTVEMTELIHSLDDSRPVTCGINALVSIMHSKGKGYYKDKGDYKPEPLPPFKEGKKKKQKETGSALFNALMQRLGWYMNIMSGSKKGDIVTRDAAEKLDIVGLNYGSKRYVKDIKNYPDRIIVGSETMVGDLPYNWECVKKYKALIGDFVWVSFDYLGESQGLGEWTYFSSYPGLRLAAASGTIDLIGNIGSESYFQQIIWGLYRKPYICVRPDIVRGETPRKGAWRFTDAIDSWSWRGCEGRQATVEVFSDAYKIRLYLNGKLLGTQKVKKYKTRFKIRYKAGILEALAFDSTGKEISRSKLTTSSDETIITLSPEKKKLRANGQDLCFIPITLTDKKGIYKPAVDTCINVTVEGEGMLQGLGSAHTKTDEVFDKNYHDTYYGRALAVVRAGYQPGKIKVTVSSEQLATSVFEINVY